MCTTPKKLLQDDGTQMPEAVREIEILIGSLLLRLGINGGLILVIITREEASADST